MTRSVTDSTTPLPRAGELDAAQPDTAQLDADREPTEAIPNESADVPAGTSETTPRQVIEARGLSLRASRGPVFGPIDLTLHEGQVVALVGHAGSGRTALLLTLAARMRPSSGDLSVLGRRLAGAGARRGLAGLGARVYAQERSALACVDGTDELDEGLRVREVIAEATGLLLRNFSRNPSHGRRSTRDFLTPVFTADEAAAIENTLVIDLSPLQRFKLRLAVGTVGAPRLLCVDDVAALHSPDDQRDAWAALVRVSEQGAALVVVSTNADTVPDGVPTISMPPAGAASELTQEA